MSDIRAQVGMSLEVALGHALVSVDYMCFPREVSDALTAKEFDGEIVLRFERDVAIYLTWCQTAGWNEVNSLLASGRSQYRPNSLTPVVANSHELWAPHLGCKLCGVEVMGWLGTPAVARLIFTNGSVLVGVGAESGFRDGDCILARPDEPMWLLSGEIATTLWRASE